jgi:hypothetical protein
MDRADIIDRVGERFKNIKVEKVNSLPYPYRLEIDGKLAYVGRSWEDLYKRFRKGLKT